MRIAVYPGSFDPVTNGHLDIIERASVLFDRLIVAVSLNQGKKPLFTVPERVDMLKEVTQPFYNVVVDTFDGLTVNYAKDNEAQIIIRGLRAISDFENEFMMALTNKKLQPTVETLFLTTKANYSYISSSAVKEVASFNGCVAALVPPMVEKRIREKFKSV